MKVLKFMASVMVLSVMFTACDSYRNNATLGGVQDTNAVSGVKDTSAAKADSTKKDSINDGNADPTGRMKN